jgi:hypothetical protein
MSNHEQDPMKEPEKRVAGLLAEYDSPGAVMYAAEVMRDAGYTRWDVHTPFPVHGMDRAMGLKPTPLGWFSFLGGLTGGSLGLLMQWWMNGIDYPLNIGGKPAFTMPSSVPVAYELTILLTAFATLFGMFGLNRLPQLYHWAFHSKRFKRVTDDRFFITVEAEDPKFSPEKTGELLEKTHPTSVEIIHEIFESASSGDGASLAFEALTGISSPLGKGSHDKEH